MTPQEHTRILNELKKFYREAQAELGPVPSRRQTLLKYHPDKLPARIKQLLAKNKHLNSVAGELFQKLQDNPNCSVDALIEKSVKDAGKKLLSPSSKTPKRQTPLSPPRHQQQQPQRNRPNFDNSNSNSDYDTNDDDNNSAANSEEDYEEDRKKTANCVRKVANVATISSSILMDSKSFNAGTIELLKMQLPKSAPKVTSLIARIKELDEQDMKEHKHHFKHMIFTDINSSNHGAKLLATALYVNGFTPAFTNAHGLKNDERLLETTGNNFGLLMSKPYAKKNMNVRFKKAMMLKFNERPTNVNGDLMRFIILDQGFKEGIDLFDVKYVHLFEPLISRADEKQAIGRGTRYCGQKGLVFHPKAGWPLHVFKYDVELEVPINNAKTMFELFVQYSNIDIQRAVFATELENAAIEAAVDNHLTSEIHTFDVKSASGSPGSQSNKNSPSSSKSKRPAPPSKILNLHAMHEYINTHFMQFKYPKVKLANKCVQDISDTANTSSESSRLISFTPTQDFVRHYFQPESAYKGLLAFHSVGTGKLCTGIATATTSFEKQGYTILWVTRHTLKPDVWKNMYDQICSITIREDIESGKIRLPKKVTQPRKYLSEKWVEPISFKQFSNLLEKKNKYYQVMAARNGEDDPLRKTLVVIDEAHKLYAPNVVGSEKPNTDILEQWIQKSYANSGNDSVRVLLMTATPYTDDGIEFIKLLNLLRPDQLPTDFDTLSSQYLSNDGKFTVSGRKKFQNQISGYVSYLNRSGDARYFAYPIIHNEMTKITLGTYDASRELDNKIDDLEDKMRNIREQIKIKRELAKEGKSDKRNIIAECKAAAKSIYDMNISEARVLRDEEIAFCNSKPTVERKACKDEARNKFAEKSDELKNIKQEATRKCTDSSQNMLKEIEKLQQEYMTLKDDRDATKEIIKSAKIENDQYKNEINKCKVIIRAVRAEKKTEMAKIKKLVRQLKTAPAEQKQSIQKILKEHRQVAKQLAARITEQLDEMRSLTTKKLVNRIKIGRVGLGKISQGSALYNRCRI